MSPRAAVLLTSVAVALLAGPATLPAVASADPGPVAATATTSGRIVGRITDEDGRPLPGVVVRVDTDPQIDPATGAWRTSVEATTDDDGHYALEDVPPGSDVYVQYAKDGYDYGAAWEGTQRADVTAGATTTKDVFMIARSAAVHGRVVDVHGVPIAGVFVGSSTGDAQLGTTDADGRFSGTVVPGDHTYGVEDQTDRYRPIFDLGWAYEQSRRFSVERGDDVDLGDIVLRHWGATPCWTEDGEWWDREPGTSFPRDPQSPEQFPMADHLCPDVLASELPTQPAPPAIARVGTPLPAPAPARAAAAARPAVSAASAVSAGTLSSPSRVTVAHGRFAVRSRCAAACGGRIVAVTRSRATARTRARDVVVAASAVSTGTGSRTLRVALNATGRRLVARTGGGLVVALTWDAPGTAKDRSGPRVRLVAAR